MAGAAVAFPPGAEPSACNRAGSRLPRMRSLRAEVGHVEANATLGDGLLGDEAGDGVVERAIDVDRGRFAISNGGDEVAHDEVVTAAVAGALRLHLAGAPHLREV